MHHGALIYFLWLLFIVFLGVLLLLTVNIIRLNRARRRALNEPTETLGTGGKPLLNEQDQRVRQMLTPEDVDVGGNVLERPAEETPHGRQTSPLRRDGDEQRDERNMSREQSLRNRQ